MIKKEDLINKAVQLAINNAKANHGGPFGALIVKEGKIIAEGVNQVTGVNDPTAHAEINAIRKACQKLNHFDLSGCEIYSSSEPCPMCLAAIYWAKLDKIYFANSKHEATNAGFNDEFLFDKYIPIEQIQTQDSAKAFDIWKKSESKISY